MQWGVLCVDDIYNGWVEVYLVGGSRKRDGRWRLHKRGRRCWGDQRIKGECVEICERFRRFAGER